MTVDRSTGAAHEVLGIGFSRCSDGVLDGSNGVHRGTGVVPGGTVHAADSKEFGFESPGFTGSVRGRAIMVSPGSNGMAVSGGSTRGMACE